MTGSPPASREGTTLAGAIGRALDVSEEEEFWARVAADHAQDASGYDEGTLRDHLDPVDEALRREDSRTRREAATHVEVAPVRSGLRATSYVRCDDLRAVAPRRLERRFGEVEDVVMLRVETIVRRLLAL